MLTSNGQPSINFTPEFVFVGRGDILGIPFPVVLFTLISIITIVILHFSRTGRYIYAVGGNESAAIASGVNTKKIKMFTYAYAGVLYGLVGIVLAARVNSATPNAGEGYELDAIAAAVIGGTSTSGGKGTVYGTVVGVLIMGILGNGLDLLNISTYIQQIVKGTVIIGAVVLDQISNNRSNK